MASKYDFKKENPRYKPRIFRESGKNNPERGVSGLCLITQLTMFNCGVPRGASRMRGGSVFCKIWGIVLHYSANFRVPYCTILQIFGFRTALFCKFSDFVLHYFACPGTEINVLQHFLLKSRRNFCFADGKIIISWLRTHKTNLKNKYNLQS